MCERMQKTRKLLLFLLVLSFGVWGWNSSPQLRAEAVEETDAEKEETETKEEEGLSKEEYVKRFEEAVSLADMMLADETFVNNKTYTKEQEADLVKILNEVTDDGFMTSQIIQAEAFATYIRNHMTLDDRQQTSTWDMLCDGDTMGDYGKPKSYGASENFVHAFRDLCVLADIPCFMLKEEKNGETIAMFYCERGWCFLNVADPNATEVTIDDVYEAFHETLTPVMITFEYDVLEAEGTSLNYVAEIYLNEQVMTESTDTNILSFFLCYDMEEHAVKMYTASRLDIWEHKETLMKNEHYYGAIQTSNANGEPPKGWVEAVSYHTTEKAKSYRGYSVFGVALRGRFEVDGVEYTTEFCNVKKLPYACPVQERDLTEDEKQYVTQYRAENDEQVKRIAEALYQDETFIFDTKFTEEEEAVVRAATKEATSWEYLKTKESQLELRNLTLPPEGEPLSDELKAYGILWYIQEHIQYGGGLAATSYSVLKTGYAICGGYILLMQDMCTFAGIPCFQINCTFDSVIYGKNFSDHGVNILRLDGKWYYADPTNIPVMREKPFYINTGFFFGYDTFNMDRIFINSERFKKEIYPTLTEGCYYDFDAAGNLGIYYRDREGLLKNYSYEALNGLIYEYTDSTGKLLEKNGFVTFETMIEEDGVQETWLCEAYRQQGTCLEGKTIIQGKEYHFDEKLRDRFDKTSYTCYKKKLLKRQYVISHLQFEPISDQVYTGDAICPEPVIRHGDKILQQGVDYTITYEYNVELTNDYSNMTSYTVEGMGDYTGWAKRYYNIVKKDISKMEASLSIQEYCWDMESEVNKYIKPDVSIALSDKDYVVTYENNNTPGVATVKIIGQNHCYGTITKQFEIKPATFDEKQFCIRAKDGTQLPQSFELDPKTASVNPEISVYWYNTDGSGGMRLDSGDYTVTYENTDKVGTATIRVQGKGKFSGTLETTFAITQKEKIDIAQCTELKRVLENKDYSNQFRRYQATYTGNPVLPLIAGVTYITEFSTKPDGLEKGVDFEVTATNNVNVGEGTLTVQGIGDYTGEITIVYDIVPKTIKREDVTLISETVQYNGQLQPPKVLISGLTEGIEFEVLCQKTKEEGNGYEMAEPVNPGYYYVAVKLLSDNYCFAEYMTEEDDCYRLNYVVKGKMPVNDATPSPTSEGGKKENGSANTPTVPSLNATTSDASSKQGVTSGTAETGAKDTETVSGGSDAETTKETAAINTQVEQVKKWKVIARKKGFLLRWEKVSDSKGYQIHLSTKKNFNCAKVFFVKPQKNSYQLTKLKSKKTYYIRIRAYQTYEDIRGKVKKRYGKWVIVRKKTK